MLLFCYNKKLLYYVNKLKQQIVILCKKYVNITYLWNSQLYDIKSPFKFTKSQFCKIFLFILSETMLFTKLGYHKIIK